MNEAFILQRIENALHLVKGIGSDDPSLYQIQHELEAAKYYLILGESDNNGKSNRDND